MGNIFHRVGIKSEIQNVYKALSTLKGISNWWTIDTSGQSEIGKMVTTRFHTLEGNLVGTIRFEIQNLEIDKLIHWKILEGPEEWLGTEVIFELYHENNFTIVLFKHINWSEEVEFMGHCSMKWGIFMLSLKQFIENGLGSPSPNDIKIDNWN